jgi:hypothetical protein
MSSANPMDVKAAQATSPDARAVQGWDSCQAQNHARYWPCDLLRAFTLQMAARGLCTSASMMLGDRGYALRQLACAHASDDARLRQLAVELFTFLDDGAPAAHH